MDTSVGEPLGLSYGALRRHELAVEEDRVLSTFEVGQSSRFVPEPRRAERVSAFRQTILITWVDPEDSRVYTDMPAYVPPVAPVQTSPSLESLEREQERVTVTFGVLWRPVLALEAWAGQTDSQRATRWHAIYDIKRENHDLRMQLTEEMRERLELVDHVARMERR
ncbi:hypothetical protein Tco_1303047 [Tanacetum coccineum]